MTFVGIKIKSVNLSGLIKKDKLKQLVSQSMTSL